MTQSPLRDEIGGHSRTIARKGKGSVRLAENRRAQRAFSRVHARTALRWRLDEWAPAALVTGVPSCAPMGADGTLVSQMAERPPSGTARAYTPSCRGRFGGCSTPRGLPGTTRPRFALQASSDCGHSAAESKRHHPFTALDEIHCRMYLR